MDPATGDRDARFTAQVVYRAELLGAAIAADGKVDAQEVAKYASW